MYKRKDNPLRLGLWHTAQVTVNQLENHFIAGQEYCYCGSTYSRRDRATSLRFRGKGGSDLSMVWRDSEPASLLRERFRIPEVVVSTAYSERYNGKENPLLPWRWYTAQVTFSQYEGGSRFIAGQEYLYCGSAYSYYDGATNLSFRDRNRSHLYVWWNDNEPPSLLQERFGEPGAAEPMPTPLTLLGLALVVALVVAVEFYIYLRI